MSTETWAGSVVVRRFLWWRVVDVRRFETSASGLPRCLPQRRTVCTATKRRVVLGARGVRRITARASR